MILLYNEPIKRQIDKPMDPETVKFGNMLRRKRLQVNVVFSVEKMPISKTKIRHEFDFFSTAMIPPFGLTLEVYNNFP